ncbi:MAG TPA: cytochrome d ubiquinol oxidase subunit II [Vicinamibacterales bacterium]
MINSTWFVLLAFTLAGYAVLDGFDLGVGTLHLVLGRTTRERTTLIDTIGPVWNGNEVWLLAAGGSMVVAFPTLYAASFSGFYLALMLVLWLLLLRGLGIEFRHQVDHDMWKHAWDVAFSVASALLALLFGVAVGNVLRGLPLDANGEFQGTFTLMLNPFAVLGGLLSVATLSLHGANWIALKTEGDLQSRARAFARVLWWPAMALLAALVAASFVVRPDFTRNFAAHPALAIVPSLVIVAAAAMYRFRVQADDLRAFVAGGVFVASILASAAAGLYPYLLPSRPGSPHPGLDIYNAASPEGSLRIALGIYLFGLALVGIYLVNIYRVWRGKVREVYH